MSVDRENHQTPDIWTSIENLWQSHKKVTAKVTNLDRQVRVIWRVLQYSGSEDESDLKTDSSTAEIVATPPRRPRSRSSLDRIVEVDEHQESPQIYNEPVSVTEEMVATPPRGLRPRSTLDRIVEVDEPQESPQIYNEPVSITEVDLTSAQEDLEDVPLGDMEATVEVPNEKRLHSPQSPRPRDARESLCEPPAKRQRLCDYMSFCEITAEQRQTQDPESQNEIADIVPQASDTETIPPPAETPACRNVSPTLLEAGKPETEPTLESLENAGLPPMQILQPQEAQVGARGGSDSETPLGSLDRTSISLGDSVQTTDSERFIRHHWGVEGTMLKIVSAMRAGARPLSAQALAARGPAPPGCARAVAAHCFSSLLKLKQHAFIRIDKDPVTLEISDITLGARFDDIL